MACPWLVVLLLALFAPPALAEEPTCANPRAAARSLLDWLQPDRWEPSAAATCLDLADPTSAAAAEAAVKLKTVLDARGLYVPVDELSDDPDHVDAQGRHRVQPIDAFPRLVLYRKGDRWLYSSELVASTDRLYAQTFSEISLRVRDAVPPAIRGQALGIHTWQAVYFALLVSVALLAGRLVQRVLSGQLAGLGRAAGVDLDVAWLRRTQHPIYWCVTAGVVRWGIPDLQLGARTSQSMLFLTNTVLSFAAVLILVRLVDVGVDFLGKRAARTESKLDDQVIPLVSRTTKVALWALGLVFILQNAGVNVGSLLAGLGIGGLAVALAAKDTVENLFGSITIFADRPFRIGDWVVIDKNIEGVVEEVGFRSTRVRTFYNSLVTVPNAKVASAVIDNYGLRARRRVSLTLGLTYSTPRARLEAFTRALRAHLEAHPRVYRDTLEVHFSGFGASALEVMVYFFLEVPTWKEELEERGRIFLEFMRIAEELEVSFAFPSTSVYLESLPEERR